MILALLAPLILGSARAAGPSPAQVLSRIGPALATVEYVQSSVVGGQKQQSRGTTDGIVLSDDGLVLVSGKLRFPVRGGASSLPELEELRLLFADGRKWSAEAVEFDNDLNLGLLRVVGLAPGERLPFLSPVREARVGVGTPFHSATLHSEEYGRQPVYYGLGINSMLHSPVEMWSLSGVGSNLLGAPLIDQRGRFVGVIAQLPMSPWAGRQVAPELSGPVGLAASRFLTFVERATQKARGQRGAGDAVAQAHEAAETEANAAWLGIDFQPLDEDLGRRLGASRGGGIVITRVVPGAPAATAGIQALEVLIELDGERIAVLQDSDSPLFARRIRTYAAGTPVTFTRERPGGVLERLTVTLGRSPKSELLAERLRDEPFEYAVREITLDALLGQRLPQGTRGVVVDAVTRAGWAGLAELPVGVVLQRINDHPVDDLVTWKEAMAAIEAERPEKVLFFARYRRETHFYVAEPDWGGAKGP